MIPLLLALGCVAPPALDSSTEDSGEPLDGWEELPSPTPPDLFEEPIRLVFKVHIEPQSGVHGYAHRLQTVETVRELAESHGAHLTIHANGDFWQMALTQGDAEQVRDWVREGDNVGPHMHPIHEEVDGSGVWTYTHEEEWTEEGVREIWEDHIRTFRDLFGEDFPMDQATPWNNNAPDYVELMSEYGFGISGGGRHEIAVPWLGHHPFFPWRLGSEYLLEDPDSPVLIVHHQPQIGTVKFHGQPPGRVFEDQTVPHLEVQLLQIYLNRMYAERSGDTANRIWLFGMLTHDYAGGPQTLMDIEDVVSFIETYLDHTSLRGNPVIQWADFDEVSEAFTRWEEEHPGVSSFNVPTPTPLSPDDITAISEAESRRIYPHPFWGMAQLLAADGDTVVDWVRYVDAVHPLGVECHELETGHRKDEGLREPRWLCWREADGVVRLDLREVTGADRLVQYDPRTGAGRVVDASRVEVGALPVILDRY